MSVISLRKASLTFMLLLALLSINSMSCRSAYLYRKGDILQTTGADVLQVNLQTRALNGAQFYTIFERSKLVQRFIT